MALRTQHEDVDVPKPSLNTRSQSRGPRVNGRMCCKKHGSASPMCSEHQFLHGPAAVAFLKTNVFGTCPGERERLRERERFGFRREDKVVICEEEKTKWWSVKRRRQSDDLRRRDDKVMIYEEETITRTLRKGFREKIHAVFCTPCLRWYLVGLST